MKAYKLLTFTLGVLLIGSTALAQPTPEEQKKIEEAQKKAMEIMKNNPQFKDAVKMMQDAEEQMRQERSREQLENEKRQKDANADHLNEFYWRNKVVSDTKGNFSDWSWGEVAIGYYGGNGKRGADGKLAYEDYKIVGSISSNGKVQMDFPSQVKNNRVISRGLFPEMLDFNANDAVYTNPEAPYLWYGYALSVLREGQKIGDLYIGNSERTTENLASPAFVNRGDEGYLAYWVYSGEACHVTYDLNEPEVKLIVGETEEIVDRYVRVDLDFKRGWNLIKIEVNGNHSIGGETRWKWKNYSLADAMPSDAKYYFKYQSQ